MYDELANSPKKSLFCLGSPENQMVNNLFSFPPRSGGLENNKFINIEDSLRADFTFHCEGEQGGSSALALCGK